MELWDGYYEDGTLAGIDLIRGEAIPEGIRHAVAEVFVMHRDGTILLMQRDWKKPNYPGRFESGASGSVIKGETTIDGAKRELREETGIEGSQLKQIYVAKNDIALYYGYVCVTDIEKDKIRLQEGETISFRWISKEDFLTFYQTEAFVPTLQKRLERFVKSGFCSKKYEMTMYTEKQLVGIAKRENNKKRNYLVVNRLQGKHIPVSPKEAFTMFDSLADIIKAEYRDEKLLLVGFAETATAIGAALATRLNTLYMQTTRENIGGVDYLFFSESHSHATEQKLIRTDLEQVLDQIERIVFVEDEVTTGNTILNIIHIIESEYSKKIPFSVASLLNGMDEAAEQVYRKRNINIHYLVKTAHETYAEIAESYQGDGQYRCIQTEKTVYDTLIAGDYLNARRVNRGSDYLAACERLWQQVWEITASWSGKRVLVIGTEEFMYPALFVAAKIEEKGNMVRCHSTTRSPIVVSRETDYPLHTRYELASFYEKDRKTFIYNLETYDEVLILTDAENSEKAGIHSLVNALRACGNKKIYYIRWCLYEKFL